MSEEPDYENMSDEELMNIAVPSDQPSSEDDPPAPEEEAPLDEPMFVESTNATLEASLDAAAETEEIPETEEASAAEDSEDAVEEEVSVEDVEAEDAEEEPKQSEAEQSDDVEEPADAEETEDADDTESKEDKDTVDYEELYKKMMAPFKANGKMIQVNTPEEAITLMQHGANYTKKMHALKPNLKMMRALENNGLLEEGKINNLIDLANKNQDAILKLVQDAKLDPMEMDTDAETTYTPQNHSVSDQEMDFHTTLEDVLSMSSGSETISMINTQWDQASKEAIYKEPQIMQVIHDQRANGIYDRIYAEIDRRRTLGTLSTTIPLIQAYKQVGDELHSSGQLVAQETPANQSKPKVLETRASNPRKAVSNGDKARAASPTRAAPKSSPKPFDPFALSDEEIMAIPTQFS
jgi:hypothetical protein